MELAVRPGGLMLAIDAAVAAALPIKVRITLMLKNVSLSATVAFLVAGIATAAPPTQAPRETSQGKEARQPMEVQAQPARPLATAVAQRNESLLEHHIARCMTLTNQEQINLSRFAAEHAQHPQVKEFVETLIRDHQNLNQRLQKFAAEQPMETAATERKDIPMRTPAERREVREELRNQGESKRETREAVREALQAGAETAKDRIEHATGYRGPSAAFEEQLYDIAKDAHKNCEQMTRDELSKHKGADFDRAFVGCQIGGHIAMLAHLKAVQSHTSGELQQIVKDAEMAVAQHKQRAEKLMSELKESKN